MLQKDIKVLKTKLEGTSNVESFSIEVYWKNTTMDFSTTTTPGSIATKKSPTSTITEPHHQPDISSTRVTEHQDIVQLKPETGKDYAKFTYDIISNTYSQNFEDGSPVKPYLASNAERVINWEFDFKSPGRTVKKLDIKLAGMDEIADNDGTANACLHKCTAIPINGSLTIEKPQFNKFFMQIELLKNIKVFKTELNNRSSVESISIVVYWNIKKASSLLEFSKSCNAMQNCLDALRCGQGTEHLAMYEKMRGQCVTMHFFSTDVFSCLTKLENSKPKPECYEKWDTKLVNEDLTEVSPDKLCKKMFGKDNCMKKVVKETCGDKDWQLLLQHFNEDTPGLKHCDFSNV
nr:hypothetical protein F35F10.3 - Caenorhabditis elegans [Caenorhabditis elegans]